MHFLSSKIFSPVICLGFRVWGTPGSGGSGWQGQTCVKHLPQVGVEVCAKFGGDWSRVSPVKEGHIGTNNLFINSILVKNNILSKLEKVVLPSHIY